MAHPTSDRNFRLPPHVRPMRYQALLSVDLAGGRFSGRESIDLHLARASDEIALHGVDLEIGRAACRAGSRSSAAWRRCAP